MLNLEVLTLHQTLTQLFTAQYQLSKALAFRGSLNLAALEPTVKALQLANDENSVPEIAAFNKVRQELLLQHCVRDDTGQPVVTQIETAVGPQTSFTFDPPSKANEIAKQLQEQFPNIDQQFRQHQQEVNKLMAEPCDISLKLITEQDLPDNMPGHLVKGLLPMLATD